MKAQTISSKVSIELSKENEAFRELTELAEEDGLMNRQPVYYGVKFAWILVALVASLTIVVLVDSLWVLYSVAFALAFFEVRAGLFGHDLNHNQIVSDGIWNDILSLYVGFVMIMSPSHWAMKHNAHHSKPNVSGEDPDYELIEGLLSNRIFATCIAKYPRLTILVLFTFECVGLRLGSMKFIFGDGKLKFPILEPSLMLLHVVGYAVLLFFSSLSFWQAIIFVVINQMVLGFYLSSIFAPNHKGVKNGDGLGYVQLQICTSRNVKSNWFSDFWFGGLNLQAAHHLFPMVPRNKLKELDVLVQTFCERFDISYHETNISGSIGEILKFFDGIGKMARGKITA